MAENIRYGIFRTYTGSDGEKSSKMVDTMVGPPEREERIKTLLDQRAAELKSYIAKEDRRHVRYSVKKITPKTASLADEFIAQKRFAILVEDVIDDAERMGRKEHHVQGMGKAFASFIRKHKLTADQLHFWRWSDVDIDVAYSEHISTYTHTSAGSTHVKGTVKLGDEVFEIDEHISGDVHRV